MIDCCEFVKAVFSCNGLVGYQRHSCSTAFEGVLRICISLSSAVPQSPSFIL